MGCYCCSEKSFADCCEPLITAKGIAETPEQLMRSRYSAFATGAAEYLLATSSVKLASQLSIDDLQQSFQNGEFVRLEIVAAIDDRVEFVASFIEDNKLQKLHENSLFVMEQGQWKYDSGELHPEAEVKLQRNDTCPCGSGKKFKKCHMT